MVPGQQPASVCRGHILCLACADMLSAPSQAWVFQPWVQKTIDKHLKMLAEAPKPTIGFHVRWGDKIEEDILFVSHLAGLGKH